MGRRKIEIKAIKDDRNRSVTFLKRKGGLFKKAHELSVLCSVDVAVIIFGHNKKLYEYSSGDINETIGRFQYVCLPSIPSPSEHVHAQARGSFAPNGPAVKASGSERAGATQPACHIILWIALCHPKLFASGEGLWTDGSQYGGAHEHKGPADFAGRGNLDDDDDDEMGTPPPEDQVQQEQIPPNHALPPHLQSQPPYMRQPAQSASPPIQNGVLYPHRSHTPQPQMLSRPQSRNMVRPSNFPNRPADFPSNQPQHQHHQVTQGPQGPNGYTFVPNPSVYNPHGMQGQAQQYYAQHSQPQQPQMPQAYMHDRRQSMPPTFPQQERHQQPQPPQQQQQQQPQQHQPPMRSPPIPKQEPQPENEPNRLPKPVPSKSRSIFTPIDDSRSLLAQHWGLGKSSDREVKMEKESRSQSVDVGAIQPRNEPIEDMKSPPKHASTMPQRNSLPSAIQPSRSDSAQRGAKRPMLKVQIPSEQSEDGGSATAESSPRESGGTAGETPAKASTDASHSSGVVLPPPSPSASAILSAGAQGPPNPFARPHPPTHNPNGSSFSSNNTNNNIETPISALPSRFVADGLLPSPSSFYPEWGFGRAGDNSNMLPSPLTFQTPVVGNGPSFLREEEGDKKRKTPEGDVGGQQEAGSIKRVKT
ncbi:MAG: hypothetical protein LQ338_007988 [Usnochroma carphineum]|nr:MAG: hypothetical protein LQ338_007988 [Usnochroma carphineum]